MLHSKAKYRRVLVDRIFQVFLALSVFAFSGYSASASVENRRSTQAIELIARIQKRKRPFISYYRVFRKRLFGFDVRLNFLGRFFYEATLIKTLFRQNVILSGQQETFHLKLLIPVHTYSKQDEASILILG